MDEVSIFAACLALSFVIFRQAIHGVIIGGVGMWLYIKVFKRKGRANKILHYLWRKGVVEYHGLPQGYVRYFWE